MTNHLARVLETALGAGHLVEMEPLMVGEDFGQYGLTPEDVPICLMWLGSIEPEKFTSGDPIPGLHTAYYYPDFPLTIRTGVEGMVRMLMDLFVP